MRLPTLLDIAAAESDDDFGASSSTPKYTTRMPPAKKATRGRAAANRVTKAEPKKTGAAGRRADEKKAQAAEEELERQAALANSKPTKGARGRPARKAAAATAAIEDEAQQAGEVLATPPASDEPVRAKAGRGRPRKDTSVLNSVLKTSQPAAVGGTKRGRKPAKATAAAPPPADEPSEIPETQYVEAEGMDVEYTEELDQFEDLPSYAGYSAPPSARRGHSYNLPFGNTSNRANSVPTAGGGDPSVNRRLLEMTKKYEALDVRYRDLKNLAVTEAEKTFDRLKKTSEEKTQCKFSKGDSTLADHLLTKIILRSRQQAYCKSKGRSRSTKETGQRGPKVTTTTGSERGHSRRPTSKGLGAIDLTRRLQEGNQGAHSQAQRGTNGRGSC